MLNHKTLKLVAKQVMSGKGVTLEGRNSPVTRTGTQRLQTVRFLTEGKEYQAIEQNSEKPPGGGS
jgi:hypothetical protein